MPDVTPRSNWKPLVLPALALTAGGFLLGHGLADDSGLMASPLGTADMDNDGLVDVQESILQTDLLSADSDLDGFSDLEEFARGSDPQSFADVPQVGGEMIAMTGRAQAGVFRAVTALYVPGGDLTGSTVTFGALVGGTMLHLDPMLFFAGASLTVQAGSNPGDAIYLLETPIPESLIMALGSTGLFATYTPPGGAVVAHASALNMQGINGVVSQVVSNVGSGGGIYRPLVDDPDIPVTWTPAQVCVQNLSTVGVVGAVLQQQVDSSFCDPISADSYCPPDCANLTGTIREIVDPLALIGG